MLRTGSVAWRSDLLLVSGRLRIVHHRGNGWVHLGGEGPPFERVETGDSSRDYAVDSVLSRLGPFGVVLEGRFRIRGSL